MQRNKLPDNMFDESLVKDQFPTIEYEQPFGKIISPSSGANKTEYSQKVGRFEDFTFNMKQRRMEAEDEIEKWENSPLKIHSHKFNQDERLKNLDHRTRGQLATFFDAWLTHHGI